jgi:Flp pilus assembly protein TadG
VTLNPIRDRRLGDQSGQALIEFMFVAFVLLFMLFGLIDFSRAISTRQVLTNISREGSNLASRGTPLSNSVAAVISSASPLTLDTNGRVIITAVTNSNGTFVITEQLASAGVAISKIGTGVGTDVTSTMPSTAVPIPQPSQTVYVTEVFYTFQAATPVGQLLNFSLPTQLYDVAYF